MSEIIHGAEKLGPRVRQVTPLPEHKLRIVFSNAEERLFDAAPLLEYPAFQPLRDESFFRLVRAEFGTICWPGDIDYCPDTLYMQSTEIKNEQLPQ